jgi:hypothetical protein
MAQTTRLAAVRDNLWDRFVAVSVRRLGLDRTVLSRNMCLWTFSLLEAMRAYHCYGLTLRQIHTSFLSFDSDAAGSVVVFEMQL